MTSLKDFVFVFFLITVINSAPLPGSEFCSNNKEDELYKFESGKKYTYDYESEATLWINDISDEAKSELKLSSSVSISPLGDCSFLMSLSGTSLSGESVQDPAAVARQLNEYNTVFRLNQQGELDTQVSFQSGDEQWSRNIKRGVISAFQAKSQSHLRSLDYLSDSELRSATVYETDILGRCRTTYSLNSDSSAESVKLNKKKSLQRCTLNENHKSSAIQHVPYKTLPEFFQGQLFIENHECNSVVNSNILNSVECKETSTYRVGSRGKLGTQAVIKQRLTFREATSSSASAPASLNKMSIKFEHETVKTNELESADFNAAQFTQEICDQGLSQGLTKTHSDNFRDLVRSVRSKSSTELINLYEENNSKCSLAGLTISQAILFADTDEAFVAIMSLMDKDAFADLKYINEYPLLAALARSQEPSENLINKLRTYLSQKPDDFPYLNKLYLVYSTLVKTYCSKNECPTSKLNEWTDVFATNLADNCAKSAKKELVVSSLKSIGNIGYFADENNIANCAAQQKNSLEVRVNAIQALRRFSCKQVENLEQIYSMLQDPNEDAEIRINSFLSLIRCSDESFRFEQFAKEKLADFLLNENDVQVLTFIIDYGKERGLTSVLNTVLNEPKVREKFSVNFKELSWNNYKFRYSVMHDSALEVDTSLVYTSKTFIPRSIRFNITLHAFGMSINFMEMGLRLEGLDEILKAAVVDELKSEKFLKRIMQSPEQLIDLLNIVAEKLKYTAENPLISLSMRAYGADIYYSRLDSAEELKKLADLLRGPRENLYNQVMTIRNLLLVDSNVKQPLLNGLAFETSLDVSAAMLVSKASSKQNIDGEGDEIDFNLNNFYSSSFSINRQSDLKINNANRLSLKKKSVFNGRLRMKIDGTKKSGSATYNLNLQPEDSLTLMSFDGKFYKLGANSQYKEVKQFKTEQTNYEECTSERFKTAFGVNLCYKVQRPKASLQEFYKYYRLESIDQDNEDEEDEDHNESNEPTRPSLLLSGPYHYHVVLQNPDSVKVITLKADSSRSSSKEEFNAFVSTQSQAGTETSTLEMSYINEKEVTNRGLATKMNFQMRRPSNGEVRFEAHSEFEYKKDETLAGNFFVNNKINKEFRVSVNFGRNKTESNIIPNYYAEALLDSKIVDSKYYRFFFELKPEAKNIHSNLVVEKSDVKIVTVQLSLTSNDPENDSELDYTLDLNAKTFRQGMLKMGGQVRGALLSSNIELTLDYSNPNFKLAKPAAIKISHLYDGAANARSHLEFKLNAPLTPIDHGFKLVFTYNLEKAKFDYVEVLLSKPGRDKPVSVFFERIASSVEQKHTTEVSFGIRDSQIELESNDGPFSKLLIRPDDAELLKSLTFHSIRVQDNASKKINSQFEVKKNEADFFFVEYNLKGNVDAIRKSTTELSRQELSADLKAKVLEYTGSVSAQLNAESSVKNNKHKFQFNFKSENLFKTLIKTSSIESTFNLENGKLDAKLEVQKVGEVKGFKIVSKSQLRSGADSSKEFDVAYEKKMADGEVHTGTGVARYAFKDFKNFASSISVPGHYESKMNLETKRTNTIDMFGYHSFKFSNKHLDGVKSERDLNLLINNKTESQGNTLQIVANLRRGDLGSIKNRDQTELFLDLNTENTMTRDADGSRSLTKTVTSVDLKSKRFNLDLIKTLKGSLETNQNLHKFEGTTKLKYPAIFTDPGKISSVDLSYKYSRNSVNNEVSFKNDYETDSKFFGSYFQVLNVDLNRQVLANGKNIKSNLNIDYKLPADQLNDKLKSVKLTVDHDYLNYKFNLKQNRMPKFNSMLKPGLVIDVSDCALKTRFDRKKSKSSYLLDVIFDLACQNKQLTNNKIYIQSLGLESESPSTKLELTTQSEIYYEIKSLSLSHMKFTSTSGLASIRLARNQQTAVSNEFSYQRSVNKANGKLETATYKLASEVDGAFSKKCELNIGSKTDYYNSFNCRLNSSRVPDVELTYGYNLKAINPNDYLLGKRGIELDVVIPGRTLRATYNSNYATPIDATDDDDDENDEREFNGTATFQWNFKKDPSKLITINLKRDNYAKGKSLLYFEVPDHPNFKLFRFQIDRTRTFDQTVLNFATIYETNSGKKNRFDITAKMSSHLAFNSFSLETNLQRPSFNTLYENKYNKNDGRLQYLSVRIGKLLKLTVDKESDPEERLISLQLTSPDQSQYTVDGTAKKLNGKHSFEASLKNRAGQRLSSLKSIFDSDNNNFDVRIDGSSNKYRFNFGIFNETLANAHVLNEEPDIVLGLATLQVTKNDEYNNLVLSLRWNRFWADIQRDLLGGNAESIARESDKFNSYFGDVYAELSTDLKSSVDSLRKERLDVEKDFKNIFYIVADSYSKYIPAHLRNENRQNELKAFVEMQMANSEDVLPLYKRFFKVYNEVAERLLEISLKIRKYSKRLSRFVPRLPIVEYNKEQLTKEVRPFENNLVVSRPTLYARNLYQFNAEFRDYVRKFGENILFVKNSLARSIDGISLRALINKYKYRSARDYTHVASVYNKRNVIGFDGEQKTLQSKCRYLLTHEMHKNRFSVVLNFNDSPYLISVFAYGQKSVDLGFNKAAIDSKPVSLPQTVKMGENGFITVTKTNVGVCVEVNHDLKVCCYEDSNSCTVATTRWFTGKLNGLLGKANNNPTDSIIESDWYLDRTCKFPNSIMKKPSFDAVKTCYAIFGSHRRALFRHAVMAIRPNGWQRVCEAAMTNDPKSKCILLKAFDHHADQEKVTIEAPDECYKCNAESKQHSIGHSLVKSEKNFDKGSDYVFLTLPCDESKYSVDLSSLVADLKLKNPLNRYYVVSVDEHDASIYLSSSNEISNFDPVKAYSTLADDSTQEVSKKDFNNGLFLAASLFSRRLAENRFLIIRSCGNCLKYSVSDALKYNDLLNARNVIVHSWGDYDIKNLESDDAEDVPVGYDEENVFLYKPSEKTVETDTLDSYKIEHKADLCQRLAVKTHGNVVNLKYLREKEVMDKISEWLEEPVAKFEYKVNKCQKLDTPYGDLLDFSYSRTKIESDE